MIENLSSPISFALKQMRSNSSDIPCEFCQKNYLDAPGLSFGAHLYFKACRYVNIERICLILVSEINQESGLFLYGALHYIAIFQCLSNGETVFLGHPGHPGNVLEMQCHLQLPIL